MLQINDQILQVTPQKLAGVKLIKPPTVFEDFRGDYVEIYNERQYKEAGILNHFVQEDTAFSHKHVLRGLHGDDKTTKLVKCVYGELYVVIANNDPDSAHYQQWQAFLLTAQNRLQVYVPPKHGTGYLVMSEGAVFHYKQDTYYEDCKQFTIKWNDPSFNMWWPVKETIRSMRDE